MMRQHQLNGKNGEKEGKEQTVNSFQKWGPQLAFKRHFAYCVFVNGNTISIHFVFSIYVQDRGEKEVWLM